MTERRAPRPLRLPWPLDQFVLPHGLLGRVAGMGMAFFNAGIERRVVELLDLRGDERVLEVGFGPGVGISEVAARLPSGSVAGIDPSQTMNEEAAARNQAAVDEGRVDLRLGTVSHLPWKDETFDAAFGTNNIQLWKSVDDGLRELSRAIKPGGLLAIGVYWWIAPRSSPPFDEYLPEAARAAGFSETESWRERIGPATALLFRARR